MIKECSTEEELERAIACRDSLPSRESYPTPELRFTVQLVLAGRMWRSLLDEKLRQLGHSASRMEVMAAILYSPPLTTQIQIAKRVGIEGPTLTRTLDMLEADGFVERLPDPADRRNKHLRLTDAGIDALNEIFSITVEMRSRLLEGLPKETVSQCTELLAELLYRISERTPMPSQE